MATDCGIIYLVQPAELVGTMRFKVGMSKSPTLDRVKKGYRKGTRYLYIMEIKGLMHLEYLEKDIKNLFKKEFKLIAGTEYFEGYEPHIKSTFLKRVEIQMFNFAEQENQYNCGSCNNTGHHKGEKGNYCYNCKWGEILIQESQRIFIENFKNFMKNRPTHMFDIESEKIKKIMIEEINEFI